VPAKAHCQITVRYYECDPLGHVNHAMYVHYFEVGRLQAMAGAGLPFADVIQQGYTVVASDIYVQYKAPALYNDVLDIQSYITRFRGARMTWQQELYRHTSGALLALAEVNGAFTLANGRPVRVPPAMRTLLDAVYMPDAAWTASRGHRSSSPAPLESAAHPSMSVEYAAGQRATRRVAPTRARSIPDTTLPPEYTP
jgi:acyl-CoA thioester hydrolase